MEEEESAHVLWNWKNGRMKERKRGNITFSNEFLANVLIVYQIEIVIFFFQPVIVWDKAVNWIVAGFVDYKFVIF